MQSRLERLESTRNQIAELVTIWNRTEIGCMKYRELEYSILQKRNALDRIYSEVDN